MTQHETLPSEVRRSEILRPTSFYADCAFDVIDFCDSIGIEMHIKRRTV